MKLSSSKLKELSERNLQSPKNKQSAPKNFLVFVVFAIFTAVKHKEIFLRNSLRKFPVKQI